MFAKRLVLLLLLASTGFSAMAQKIIYSEPDKDDTRRLDFEIVGKINGNFLVYKNIRNRTWITMLDNEMQQVGKVEQEYIPSDDRLINVDFFPYNDFFYMVYQYQKKNIVYCKAAKIDGKGNKIGDLIELDTTQIGFAANNKIYTVLTSEDKSKIGIVKVNSKNRKVYQITTILLNDKLELQKKSRLSISMEERNDYLSDFQLDNEGDIIFSKFLRNNNDNINKAAFIVKYAQADTLMMKDLQIEKTWLDEIFIKVDNYNKRYFLSSFYYKENKGNIDGYYFYIWDKATTKSLVETTTVFSDELRKEARGDAGTKSAFNDFFIKHIITRKDGGFIIASEAYYTTSRFNNWNRWDYLYGSPFMSPGFNNYYYSPYYSRSYWNSRSNSGQAVRYHADNMAILSFSNSGQLEWNNVISKGQFDDESDDLISYQLMNTGGELHFLFNSQERRNNLLTDFSLTPGGQLNRNPTLKNLERGYDFMPKYGKQVSARQMIIPCQYRNYICFAKVEYN